MKIPGNCSSFGIGSVPYTDPATAWDYILKYFPDIPFWPQLPKRVFAENMYAQFSEHIPGRIMEPENDRFYIDRTLDLQPDMEEFYNRYLKNDPNELGLSREYCEGLYFAFDILKDNNEYFDNIKFIKGQITGPISFGLQVMDQDGKPILYDEMLHDILVKNLERKAQWQLGMLKKINDNVIISVDEPYLSSIGSGFLNLDRDKVIADLESVFKSLKCIKATHCCGNTDWSMILDTSAEILLFDAYNYSKNLALFSDQLKEFLASGGCIGWGIVPTTGAELESTNQGDLINRLESGIELLVDKGLDREVIMHQSVITPACGLGPMSITQAIAAMELTHSISEYIQKKYELI
jgi:hypothetical protein